MAIKVVGSETVGSERVGSEPKAAASIASGPSAERRERNASGASFKGLLSRQILPSGSPAGERPAAHGEAGRDDRGTLPNESSKLWRSLEELADTPGFREMLHREFPRHASEWDLSVDRRRFLQLSSASLALAGLTACTKQPPEKIVPYVQQPEDVVPGKPLFFATTMTLAGFGVGLLAESHLGRPTKVEGNPDHPASWGSTDLFAQASVLELYDPDRSRAITRLGDIRDWDAFVSELAPTLTAQQALGGEGLRILSGSVSSPTLAGLRAELAAAMPKAGWHHFEPAVSEATEQGARAAWGQPVTVRWDLHRADVILAIDADFLTSGPGAVRYAKEFARRRQAAREGHGTMPRLYMIDSSPSATSTVADHRLTLAPSAAYHAVLALAAQLGVAGATAPSGLAAQGPWLEAVAADLLAHRGSGLVLAGEFCPPEVHTLVHGINSLLGNLGTTVLVTDQVTLPGASLDQLIADVQAGRVDTLLILGSNPIYASPRGPELAAALERVRLRVHLGLHHDETAEYCHWHLPEAHYLESWGDVRAFDGTISLVQPIIEPLYNGKTATQLIAALLGRSASASDELVRAYWQQHWQQVAPNAPNFERFWRQALHDGLIPETTLPPRALSVDAGAVQAAASAIASWTSGGLELLFRPDPCVLDGRFANNGWLQECPKPLTKLTWDNALLISPRTARELGLGDLVAGDDQWPEAPLARLEVQGRALEVPVWVLPGQADQTLVLHLGYGRWRAGKVGNGVGVHVNPIRPVDQPFWVRAGVNVTRTEGHYILATTQDHHSMEGRDLVRMGTLAAFQADPHGLAHSGHGPGDISLMPGTEFPYDGYAWGMTVDLSTCTGCNACVIACQAENNIPVVGKDQVSRGREMHWIRIDRYFAGEDADQVTAVLNQPVYCMHCEQAPCEVVCPVAATTHSDEGLNDMVYNRCVGTRYCSNNCPYKVRRFNFLLYQDFETPSLKLGRNPDVTVRSRGVMEKCSYCVQRINHARIDAKREGRKIRDGEILTACQQACPSDALLFGDVNDAASKVAKAKSSPLNYGLLAELGTRPRTTYLARLRHPNPALEPAAGQHGEGHGKAEHGASGHG